MTKRSQPAMIEWAPCGRTVVATLVGLLLCAPVASAQASITTTTDWSSEELVRENWRFGDQMQWNQMIELVSPLASIKGHCCAVCNEGKPCRDCRDGHSDKCTRYRDKGEHYLEIGYDTVARFAESAAKTLSSQFKLQVDVPIEGVPVSASASEAKGESESQDSSLALGQKTRIPVGTADHVPAATCWRVSGSATLTITLFLTKRVTFPPFGDNTTEYILRCPPVVSIAVSNDVTETTCPCADRPTSMNRDEQRSVAPEKAVRPLVDDAPAFGMAVDKVGIHPDTATIEIGSASPAFVPSTKVVLVTADESTSPTVGDETPASAKRGDDKPLVTITPDMIAKGLSALLIAGDHGDDGTAPNHYLKFEQASAPPDGAETIRSVTASDGTPMTFQAYRGTTAPVAVHTSGLPPGTTLAVGTGGETSQVAATLTDAVAVTQRDSTGKILDQTYFGTLTGAGLAALKVDDATIGLIDDQGQWVEGSQRPLSDVLLAPQGVPQTGTYSPDLQLDRHQVGEEDEFTAIADKRQLEQMARSMRTTVEVLLQMGVTRLSVEGKEVDSSPWSSGRPAQYTGRAPKGAKQVNVSATYDFLKDARAVDAVGKAYDRIENRARPALDAVEPGVRERLESNLRSGRERASNLVRP